MEQIIGRKTEIKQLTEYYHSGKAEFVAVYGRRRIGKTYLVHNLFNDEFVFEMSGSKPSIWLKNIRYISQIESKTIDLAKVSFVFSNNYRNFAP